MLFQKIKNFLGQYSYFKNKEKLETKNENSVFSPEVQSPKNGKYKKNATMMPPKLKVSFDGSKNSIENCSNQFSKINPLIMKKSKGKISRISFNGNEVKSIPKSLYKTGKFKKQGSNEEKKYSQTLSSGKNSFAPFFSYPIVESYNCIGENDKKRFMMFGNFDENEIMEAKPLRRNISENTYCKIEELSYPLRDIIMKNRIKNENEKKKEKVKINECNFYNLRDCNCKIF